MTARQGRSCDSLGWHEQCVHLAFLHHNRMAHRMYPYVPPDLLTSTVRKLDPCRASVTRGSLFVCTYMLQLLF